MNSDGNMGYLKYLSQYMRSDSMDPIVNNSKQMCQLMIVPLTFLLIVITGNNYLEYILLRGKNHDANYYIIKSLKAIGFNSIFVIIGIRLIVTSLFKQVRRKNNIEIVDSSIHKILNEQINSHAVWLVTCIIVVNIVGDAILIVEKLFFKSGNISIVLFWICAILYIASLFGNATRQKMALQLTNKAECNQMTDGRLGYINSIVIILILIVICLQSTGKLNLGGHNSVALMHIFSISLLGFGIILLIVGVALLIKNAIIKRRNAAYRQPSK